MYDSIIKAEVFSEPDFPVYSSVVNKDKLRNTVVIPHTHNQLELMKIIKGPVNVKIGINSYSCNKGDIIFIPSQTIHEVTADTMDKMLIGLVFDVRAFGFRFFDYNFNILLNSDKMFKCIFSPGDCFYDEINDNFTKAVIRYHNRNNTFKSEITAYILLLTSSLLNFYEYDIPMISIDAYSKIKPAIDYINEHYSEKIYISGLSGLVNVCNDHFIRLFKSAMNQTPSRYILNVRIQKAMAFLASSQLSIAEISEKTGFSNYAHFSKTFTRINKVTPRTYRQRCKNGIE